MDRLNRVRNISGKKRAIAGVHIAAGHARVHAFRKKSFFFSFDFPAVYGTASPLPGVVYRS